MDGAPLPLLPALVFAGVWAAVNLAFWLARRARGLCAHGSTQSGGSVANELETAPGAAVADPDDCADKTAVELVSPLHLRISTGACSDAIASVAQSRVARSAAGARLIDAFYGIGVYVSVASMLVCVAVLLVAAAQIAAAVGARLGAAAWTPSSLFGHAAPGMYGDTQPPVSSAQAQHTALARRLLHIPTHMRHLQHRQEQQQQQQHVLHPLIPGITLPMAHIWYYLLSLGICAIIHELGHAFAAARANIRIRRVGMFIMGIYPGAFVELARSRLERAPVAARLRVACAGIWHNAVTALAVWLLLRSGGLGVLMRSAGWAAADGGVVVVDIARSSPLYGRLPLLSTVYRIDDVSLQLAHANSTAAWANSTHDEDGFGAAPIARWTSVLTTTWANRDTNRAGYCVAASENADDGLCCEMSPQFPLGESPDGDIFCFDHYADGRGSSSPPEVRRTRRSPMCFDLRNTLERTRAARCQTDGDCGRQDVGGHWPSSRPGRRLCVLPSSPFANSRVLRLHYREPDSRQPSMLIYAGSPAGLWLEVQVSSLMPRWMWLPYWLPSWTETLLQYILSFSLALCLLNATPARHLDGDLILRHVVLLFEQQRRRRRRLACASSSVAANTNTKGGLDSPCNILASQPSPLPRQKEPKAPATDPDCSSTDEISTGGQRLYASVTLATTVLLAWCVAGSVVLLIL